KPDHPYRNLSGLSRQKPPHPTAPHLQVYSEAFLSGIEAPQPSVSSREADCQFRVTISWAQFRNCAPFKEAPVTLAPSSTALKKFAPSRWAPGRSAPQSFIPLRSAPLRAAPQCTNRHSSSP